MPDGNIEVAAGSAPISFDFERHGRDSAERYRLVRPLYDDFCQTVVRLLNDVCRVYTNAVHSVVARAKEVESFYAKAIKPLETDPDKPKYRDPLREITDLAGARVITYFLDTAAHMDRLIGPDGRMTEFSYDFEARNVRSLGFTNLQQLDDCVRGFNADQLNSVMYSTRQGQLSRFEYLLAAGMAENFIRKHRWKDETWFINRIEGMLAKFREAGIPVRQYSPDERATGGS